MNVLSGREREWSRIVRALADARRGTGSVLLVEGETGVGRSRILADAVAAANRQGMQACLGRADELTRWTPLSPIATALGTTVWQFARPDDSLMRLSARLLCEIEDRLRTGPLLIALDDVQWADAYTLAALQSFPAHLLGRPVVWLIARRDGVGDVAAARLFQRLAESDATRLRLEELAPDAVTELVTDAVGAPPDEELTELVAAAAGNLALLTELVQGLRDERAVQVREGTARLLGSQLPGRLTATVRQWLGGFSVDTIGVLEVAAILGRRWRAADVADVLGRTAADVLRATREAMRSRILMCPEETAEQDELCFRHDLVRQVVAGWIAPSVRAALHRQVGLLLLRRGAARHEAVAHLMRGALPGDAIAVRALAEAAQRELDTAPESAAAMAAKALDLTTAGQPERAGLVATHATALVRSGHLTEAAELVGQALTQALDEEPAARLRTASAAVMVLTGRRTDALAEIDHVLAADRDTLPESVVDTARAVRLVALAGTDLQRPEAEDILASGTQQTAAAAAAHVALSRHLWLDGDLEASIEHARQAATCPVTRLHDVPMPHPGAVLAELLGQVGEGDRAEACLADALREVGGSGPLAVATGITGAWVSLSASRPDEAVTAVRAGLEAAESLGIVQFVPSAHAVLAAVALRRGELADAERHLADGAGVKEADEEPAWGWVDLRVTAARHGTRVVVDRLTAEFATMSSVVLPAAAAWFVRAAVEHGETGIAAIAVRAATELAERNPTLTALAASSAHARGLLERDPEALRTAMAGYRDQWAAASAAEDLAVMLSRKDSRSPEVVRALDAALEGYQATDAAQDIARVRSRLRTAGVRRRHWTYAERPETGWASLTDTEREVVELVATGLTNRQAAARMFVSPHTVHAHLGRIFRKLGVRSRVELTGLRHRAA